MQHAMEDCGEAVIDLFSYDMKLFSICLRVCLHRFSNTFACLIIKSPGSEFSGFEEKCKIRCFVLWSAIQKFIMKNCVSQ